MGQSMHNLIRSRLMRFAVLTLGVAGLVLSGILLTGLAPDQGSPGAPSSIALQGINMADAGVLLWPPSVARPLISKEQAEATAVNNPALSGARVRETVLARVIGNGLDRDAWVVSLDADAFYAPGPPGGRVTYILVFIDPSTGEELLFAAERAAPPGGWSRYPDLTPIAP